jgi:hypothetical protein
MVYVLGATAIAAIGARAQASSFSLLLRHFQALTTPQAKHPRQARTLTFGDQQPANPPVAEPWSLTNQLQHPLHDRGLVAARLRLVTLTRSRLI